jgi:hypothetical protein
MTCREALDLVEPVAAGDVTLDADARAHFESCPSCASALATAQRLEAALCAWEAPAAPSRFASVVLQRIWREQWRAEQRVDWLFNVSMIAALVLVVGGVFALLNVGAVMGAAATTWSIATRAGALVTIEIAPTVHTYTAAAGLLVSALSMWWWAERTLWR